MLLLNKVQITYYVCSLAVDFDARWVPLIKNVKGVSSVDILPIPVDEDKKNGKQFTLGIKPRHDDEKVIGDVMMLIENIKTK